MTNIEYLRSRLHLLQHLFPIIHNVPASEAVIVYDGKAAIHKSVSCWLFYVNGYQGPTPCTDVQIPGTDHKYSLIDTAYVASAQELVKRQLESQHPRETFERRYRQVMEAMLACAVAGPEDVSIRDA